MKQNKQTAAFVDAKTGKKAQKQARKLERAQRKAAQRAAKKAAKNAILPIHKRPIVCPPDKAGRGGLFRLGGLICRALVIWMAAAGLVIFISSALEFGVSNLTIFLASLFVVAMGMIFRLGWIGKLASILTSVGTVGGLIAINPRLPMDLFYGILSMYNAALDRLYKVGYLAYVQYKITLNTGTPREELLTAGVCLLTVLVTLLFTACFVKKVRIIPPAILATTFLVVLLTFNIYSNRIESNLGITLVIVSFASMLVMGAYDRLYHGKELKRHDTEMKLFQDDDRPVLPPEYELAQAERAARKKAKADMRKKRREQTVTVEDELNDYFGNKKKTGKKKITDPKAKKEKKAAHRAMMKQVRAVKAYDRVTEQSRSAMGGYAAAAVLLACLIAIALPALVVKGNFNTIDAIDEKMELARNYVTALLRGDDNALDRLEYKADSDNFKPHSTELEQLNFTGKQMFYVQARNNMNFYLRGWVGTGYENGAWLAVSDETLDAYQALFGKDSSPAEELKYDFYHYMKPELVDDPAYTENLLTKYKGNQMYGFVNLLVSVRRVNSPDTLTYFPVTYDPRYGLMEYNSTTPHKLTFVNYYDGLYTGRKWNENGLSYATMTYAPIMTDEDWILRQAILEAAFNLQKEAMLVQMSTGGTLTLTTNQEKNGTVLFQYTYKQGKNTEVWRFYHPDTLSRDENGNRVVTTPYGTLKLEMDGSKVLGATVTDVWVGVSDDMKKLVDGYTNLVDQYEHADDALRAELREFFRTEKNYGDFVYQTYLDVSNSDFIKELAATIKAQAHTERVEITEVTEPDDPETPEYDPFTYEEKKIVNVPVDVTLAAVRNSSDPAVYAQRDLLVRNVIDYIIDELGCEYTIEPDLSTVDPTLDGVENFLRNTKEGYCVQFASAAALILREMGIPVRYVEGYIASDLSKISRDDFVYGGYVRDYQAHAWIEVYFDGVGWIQYETTPQYYVGMYGVGNTVGTTPQKPVLPEVETDTPDDPFEPETDDEVETDETDTSEETTGEEDRVAAEVARNSLIVVAVMAVLAAIVAIISTFVSRARAAEDHRQSVAAQILENGFGANTNEEDRRELAFEMVDAVTNLLTLYGLSPKPGEFKEEYAERLTAELTVPDDGKAKKPRAGAVELPNLHIVMEGISAEEFGHGMSIPEMKETAALYLFLHAEVRKRLAFPERFKLRYFKRKI